jgi:hypothetical protein
VLTKALHHDVLGSGGIAVRIFFTSALGGGEWSASRHRCFTLREEPRYPLDRRLGGSRAGLDTVAKRKFPITAPAGT